MLHTLPQLDSGGVELARLTACRGRQRGVNETAHAAQEAVAMIQACIISIKVL